MKELDELITYIENDLIGEHKDIEIIDESIKKYAELYHKKQLKLYGVVKSLPVDRETALKVREDIINEHYKDDPNKSTFGLAFITCYDWLAKLCNK